MNTTPIHIRVTETERHLFEVAAEKTGMTITQLVKKAVLAYVKSPLAKDEIAEALEHLEKFNPSPAQLARHQAVADEVESGRSRGLNKQESLDLLKKLQDKPKP
ncbi:MAG: hypothetical protein V4498_05660 [candidate division FCPU426 bacterium]